MEIVMAMRLLGVTKLSELDPGHLECLESVKSMWKRPSAGPRS